VAIQVGGLVKENLLVELLDMSGRKISETCINAGQTIAYFDVQAVYTGMYLVRISNGGSNVTQKIEVSR
jgi:hypothetical protein